MSHCYIWNSTIENNKKLWFLKGFFFREIHLPYWSILLLFAKDPNHFFLLIWNSLRDDLKIIKYQCSGMKVGFKLTTCDRLLNRTRGPGWFKAVRYKRHTKQITFFLINALTHKRMLSAWFTFVALILCKSYTLQF